MFYILYNLFTISIYILYLYVCFHTFTTEMLTFIFACYYFLDASCSLIGYRVCRFLSYVLALFHNTLDFHQFVEINKE
jgi:hypothetical protein